MLYVDYTVVYLLSKWMKTLYKHLKLHNIRIMNKLIRHLQGEIHLKLRIRSYNIVIKNNSNVWFTMQKWNTLTESNLKHIQLFPCCHQNKSIYHKKKKEDNYASKSINQKLISFDNINLSKQISPVGINQKSLEHLTEQTSSFTQNKKRYQIWII